MMILSSYQMYNFIIRWWLRISNGLTGILSGERGRGCHDGGDGGDGDHGHGDGGQVVMEILLLVLRILAMKQFGDSYNCNI